MNNRELAEEFNNRILIRVVGIGNGGSNAVDYMYDSGIDGVKSEEFIAINTDSLALRLSKATCKLNIGNKLTKGVGAEGEPEIGEKAARESREEIIAALKGADMIFIIAGMGGGTGTGAAPIVAEIARDMGCLTIGVVTRPFEFEGEHRIRQAKEGIARLKDKVDTLLVISNERLRYINPEITSQNAFAAADKMLYQPVQLISYLVNVQWIIGMDFADITSIIKRAGLSYIGLGRAKETDWVEQAVKEAINFPLMEKSIHNARGIIVNFQVPPNVDLKYINNAAAMIHDAASEDVELLWGVAFDENMEDVFRITMIATNFDEKPELTAADISSPQPATIASQVSPAAGTISLEETSSGDDLDLSDIIRMLENR